jgi:hypothetical protein
MKIRYGGDLQIGDFIMVASSNYVSFGWYCGQGRNTIQFYQFTTPANVFTHYTKWKNGDLGYAREDFAKNGFTLKSLYKEYIYGGILQARGSRVVKITDPESIFTEQEDLNDYLESKQVLNNLNFPAK